MTDIEKIRKYAVSCAGNDWVILIDPDERISCNNFRETIEPYISKPSCGMIRVPWFFYFRNKKLTSTRWGFPQKVKPLLIHVCLILPYHSRV